MGYWASLKYLTKCWFWPARYPNSVGKNTQIADPMAARTMYRPRFITANPVGTEMNARTTGMSLPTRTEGAPYVEPHLRGVEVEVREQQVLFVAFDDGAPGVPSDFVGEDRAGDRPDGANDDHVEHTEPRVCGERARAVRLGEAESELGGDRQTGGGKQGEEKKADLSVVQNEVLHDLSLLLDKRRSGAITSGELNTSRSSGPRRRRCASPHRRADRFPRRSGPPCARRGGTLPCAGASSSSG